MPMAEPVTATTGKNWAAIILGAVIAIIGLVLAIGGVWLAALGGSLYYVITGVAMMIAGWLLFRQQLLGGRSEEHTSELQSLMRISYAVLCLKKKTTKSINKQPEKYIIDMTKN